MRARVFLTGAMLLVVVLTAGAQQQTPRPTPTPSKALNVAGKWTMTLELSIGTATPALDLKQDGEKITGTYTGRYGTSDLTGTLKGRTIEFSLQINAEGQLASMNFTGEVSADAESMKGTATIEGLGDATWSARRTHTEPASALTRWFEGSSALAAGD